MESQSSTAAQPSVERASRPLFWIPVVALDLVLLALLPHTLTVLAAAAALVLVLFLFGRPVVALAVAAAGIPLLNPVNAWIGTDRPLFLFGRLLVFVPFLILAWNRLWGRPAVPGRSWTREPILFWAVVLGLVLAIGVLGSPSPLYGTMKIRFYVVVNLVLFVGAFYFLRRGERREDRDSGSDFGLERDGDRGSGVAVTFFRAIFWLQVAIAAVGFVNYFLRFYDFRGRLQVLEIGPIWLARHMGLGVLALLTLRALGRAGRGQLVFGLGLLLLIFFLAGSRGPTLALAGAVVLWFALAPRFGRSQGWVVALLLLAGAIVLLLVVFSPEIQSRLYPSSGRQASNFVRKGILLVSQRAFGFIEWRGVGTGGFARLAGFGDERFYPHNLLVELAVENGILGIAALAGFLLAVVRRWLHWGRELRAPDPVLRRAVACFLFYAFLNAQFSGDIFANEWLWLFAGALAAWAPWRRRQERAA